jgi:hypothetical protein
MCHRASLEAGIVSQVRYQYLETGARTCLALCLAQAHYLERRRAISLDLVREVL